MPCTRQTGDVIVLIVQIHVSVCSNSTVLKEHCDQWYDFECELGKTRVHIGLKPGTDGCCPLYRCGMSFETI